MQVKNDKDIKMSNLIIDRLIQDIATAVSMITGENGNVSLDTFNAFYDNAEAIVTRIDDCNPSNEEWEEFQGIKSIKIPADIKNDWKNFKSWMIDFIESILEDMASYKTQTNNNEIYNNIQEKAKELFTALQGAVTIEPSEEDMQNLNNTNNDISLDSFILKSKNNMYILEEKNKTIHINTNKKNIYINTYDENGKLQCKCISPILKNCLKQSLKECHVENKSVKQIYQYSHCNNIKKIRT